MSKMITQKITCPTCNNEQECSLYSSMNVTLNPLLKEKVSKNDYNNLLCEQCGEITHIEMDMLYHDMDKKFIVWCVPSGVTDYHRNQLPKKTNNEINQYFQNVVFTKNRLETYLAIDLCNQTGSPQNSNEIQVIHDKIKHIISYINNSNS